MMLTVFVKIVKASWLLKNADYRTIQNPNYRYYPFLSNGGEHRKW